MTWAKNAERTIYIAKTLERLPDSLERLPKTLERLPDSLERLSKTLERLPDSLERLSKTLERLSKTLERLSKTLERLPDSLERLATECGDFLWRRCYGRLDDIKYAVDQLKEFGRGLSALRRP